MDALERLLAQPVPTVLSHYTTQSGLIGIFKTKRLWATQIQYQNDGREFFLAAERVHLAGQPELSDPVVPDGVREYVQHMAGGTAANRICVASLTEEGDLLSQWRGYCSPGDGYAIAFHGPRLAEAARRQPPGLRGDWFVAPVTYDPVQHDEIARIIARRVRDECASLAGASTTNIVQDAINVYLQMLLRYGPLLKDATFAEEKEWRLVSPPIPHGGDVLHFRRGRYTLIPYVQFELAEPSEPLNIVEVIVGPGPHPTLSTDATSAFLFETQTKFNSARGSKVQYREW